MKLRRLLPAIFMIAPVCASAVVIGEVASTPLTLPYFEDFQGEEDPMSNFTIIDENNDGLYWKWLDQKEAGVSGNISKPSDDWLILRPVKMKANTDYFLSLNSRRYRASYKERFEVYIGKEPNAQAMTQEVIPPSIPADAYKHNYEATIRVNEDGEYYIGIHAISDKNNYYVIVDDISLKAGASDTAPAAPEDFVVNPDPTGELSVDISFKVPATTVTGDNAGTLGKAYIFRDETVIHTFDGVSPGEEYSWTDTDVTAGDHLYEAAVENAIGLGDKAKATVYVGLRHPQIATEVTLTENDTYGEVTLSWTAPDKDRTGAPLDPAKVSYRIAYPTEDGSVTVAENIKGTTYSFKALSPEDRQEFLTYHVYASTNGGENNIPSPSNTLAVGTPFSMPYQESFNTDSGYSATPLASKTLTGVTYWYWYDDGEYSLGKIHSQDNDNGYIAMYAPNINYSGSLYTAKIDLRGTSHPALSYYTYKMANDDNNTIDVLVANPGSDFVSVSSTKVSECNGEGWVKVVVPLTRYNQRIIQVGLQPTVVTDSYTPIDNLRVYDMPESDLAIERFEVPAVANANEPFEVKALVANNGYSDQSDVTVKLSIDGKVMAESTPFDIISGDTYSVSFPMTLSVFDGGEHTLSATVVSGADDNMDNNTAESALSLEVSEYPVVDDLSGKATENGVQLTWTSPDTSLYEHPEITDDFESYPRFSNTNVGPWTFYDGDGGLIGGIGSGETALDFPGISGAQSWWVMDGDYEEIPTVGYAAFWMARSGSKYLMQEYTINKEATEYVTCDDWIISPELSGKEQKISFWYKAYNLRYKESFEFLTSETGNDPSCFKTIETRQGFDDNWTLFTYTVPADTKYFAIRCTSRGALAMFIDDVTYTPGGDAVMPHISGFNVYRDGACITPEPIATDAKDGQKCSFTDTGASTEVHNYHVTAVYDKGESLPSNLFTIDPLGITSFESTAETPIYYNLQGVRIERPESGTLCIELKGGKSRKVVIR